MNFDEYRNRELNDYLNAPEVVEMYKCDECGVYFETLNAHEDKMLGDIEICNQCLNKIKQYETNNSF